MKPSLFLVQRAAPEQCRGAMADDDTSLGDGVVGEFATYEDYLDSQISTTDIYYLEDEDLARQLVVSVPHSQRSHTHRTPSAPRAARVRVCAAATAVPWLVWSNFLSCEFRSLSARFRHRRSWATGAVERPCGERSSWRARRQQSKRA